MKKEGGREGGKDRKSERERNLLFFLSSFDSLKSAYFFHTLNAFRKLVFLFWKWSFILCSEFIVVVHERFVLMGRYLAIPGLFENMNKLDIFP